jgi:predicted nucleic acid-binding protein
MLRNMLASEKHLTASRFNVAELLVGVNRADDPERELRSVDALLQNMTVLEFGPEAARLFARITALLQQQGKPAGDMDVLIAATALAAGEPLITANPVHFRNIPGLTVDTY